MEGVLPFDPATVPWPFVLAFASLAVIFLLFQRRADAFAEIGFSSKEVWLLCLGSMAGWSVNIPVAPLGDSYLAVNLGGALVPVILVIWWIRQGKLQIARAAIGTLVVSLVVYAIVRFEPELGIIATYPWFFLPPAIAFAFAIVSSPMKPLASVPVAYAAGSLGALIGADVFNVPKIAAYYSTSGTNDLVSIGGAGVFDMVFLAGALAMAADLAVVLTLEKFRPANVKDVLVTHAYPAKPVAFENGARAWQAFVRLPDPTPLERAFASVALSDAALHEGDPARSVRFSWHAVETMLAVTRPPDEDPEEGSTRARDGHAALERDAAVLAAVAERARTAGAPRVAPVTRREAGEANDTAKLIVGTLAPGLNQLCRLEGY